MPIQRTAIDVKKGSLFSAFAEQDFSARLQRDGVLHEVVESEIFKVEDGATGVVVSYECKDMPVDEKINVLKVRVLISYDDGEAWQLLFSFTARGGVPVWPEDSGMTGSRSFVSHPIHRPRVTGRLLKVEWIPLVPLRSDLDLRVY